MIRPETEDLIERLAREAEPVRPLAGPLSRAGRALLALALPCGLALGLLADPVVASSQAAGREALVAVELAAMLVTAALAIIGAYFLSVPGSSRGWLLAPLPPFLLWLGVSAAGCLGHALLGGDWQAWNVDCLLFILAAGGAVGVPLMWRLARARPIDPVPVALLGGLGSSALAAFLLHFFHPSRVTALDLAVHLVAIGLVIAAAILARRAALRPA